MCLMPKEHMYMYVCIVYYSVIQVFIIIFYCALHMTYDIKYP